MGSMQASPALELSEGRTPADWSIGKLDAPLGALVKGVDASQPLQAAQVMAMKQALMDRHILLFRGQCLDDDQFLRLASYFGSVYRPPAGEQVLGLDPYSGALPDIVKVSNVDGGVLGRYALAAHTDHHWT